MGGHHKKDERSVPASDLSASVAVALVGFVAATMSLLYLINSSDPQVKSMSRKTLSVCFAIFTAVNIEHATVAIVHQPVRHMRGDPRLATCAIDFLAFVIWYFVSVFWSLKVRRDGKQLFAVLQAIPHASAFLFLIFICRLAEYCAEAVAGEKMERYGLGLLVFFCVAVLGCVCIMRVCAILAKALIEFWLRSDLPDFLDPVQDVRIYSDNAAGGHGSESFKIVETFSGGVPEGAHDLRHAIDELFEAHEEATAMVCGNSMCRFMLNALGWSHQHVPNFTKYKTLDRLTLFTWKWFGYLFAWSGLILLAIHLMKRFSHVDGHGHLHSTQNMEFFLFFTTLTMAWNIVEWFFWLLQLFDGLAVSVMYMMVVRATFATLLFSGSLVLADKLADNFHGVEIFADLGIIQVGGFALGFVWEKAFAEAVHLVDGLDGDHGDWSSVICNLLLLALLVPGWWWFMVPKAMEATPSRKHGYKPAPATPAVPRRWQRAQRSEPSGATVVTRAHEYKGAIELSSKTSFSEGSAREVTTRLSGKLAEVTIPDHLRKSARLW